jgi:predicted NAD-dependent protein-ADP-ribosyltransferase YbiA (DUF1768 family)
MSAAVPWLGRPPAQPFWRFSLITQFKGQYEFLDPAYYCLAEYDGVMYNSAEAAYLAAQFDDPYFQSMFRNPALPIWRARDLSKKFQRRRDWTPELSLEIMRQITLDKFSRTPRLHAALLDTGDEQIVAENNWHEQFWGCCICNTRPDKYGRRFSCLMPGRNHVGEILMSVRSQLVPVAQAG